MSTMSFSTVILDYQEQIRYILKEFVHGGYSALMEYMRAPLAACCILYIAILGWSVTNGWLKITYKEIAKATLKIGLIYMFAMSWGNFSEIVINIFQTGADEISDALLNTTGVSLPHDAGSGMAGTLQTISNEISDIGTQLWTKGSITRLGPLFGSLFIWISGAVMIAVAFFEITMAEVLQSTLFTVAPIFLVFTLFKPTQGFFDRWVGGLAGCSFLFILVNVTVAINCSIYQLILGDYSNLNTNNYVFSSFIPFFLVSLLAIFQIIKVSNIAMNLGGSIGSSSGTALVGSAVGSFLGSTVALSKGTRSVSSSVLPKVATSARSGIGTIKHIAERMRKGEV